MQTVVQIIGTTGVGKSQLSIELAKALGGEIINSDSMQVYKGLDIITNKHPVYERCGIPHHILGVLDYKEEYRIGHYARDALEIIDRLHEQQKMPVIVGGTAYYATSLLFKDMLPFSAEDIIVTRDNDVDDAIEDPRLLAETSELYADLQRIDPQMAARWHPKDRRKIRRSLQIFYETGTPQSEVYAAQRESGRLGPEQVRYRTLFLWLWADQEVLDNRLDSRIDTMMSQGLLQEVREMYQMYQEETEDGKEVDTTRGIFQAIGFKEFLPFLRTGTDEDLKAGLELMKAATRRYARRQIKWIKNKLLLQCQQAGDQVEVIILDATDLTQWEGNVKQMGLRAGKEFLHLPRPFVVEDYVASPLRSLLVPKTTIELSSDPSAWQQWSCDVCKTFSTNTLEGKQIHLKGRAHKTKIEQAKKRAAFEEWRRQQMVED